ncbi:MAG TPA: S8 family serine peptidase [Micromonosporaceae bacterium]|nr:S8 family serine peptidase [Micromonosporaceae bacterium]
MRRTLLAALFAGVVAVAGTAVTAASASAASERGDYIVMLQSGADSPAVAAEHARAHGAAVGHVYRYAIKGYSASMSAAAAARIGSDPRVLLVQPDGVVSIAAQTLPTGINRVDAELSPTARINGVDERVNVDVAIIDTGIDLTHPDLNVYTAGAKNCSTGNSANDGNGHGTHVAGTVGALDNSIGVVGVAPGARVWPVRVLNNAGSGSWASVICGIDYVTAHASEIEVANMSLGGSGSDSTCAQDAMHQAICNSVAAGVTYAVAAGNSASNANNFVPATFAEVITVSALADFNGVPGGGGAATCRADVDDTFADFSNFGADVDLIAPGVCILSTWKGGGYNTISGTSMASPHVAGGAALYKATHPTASPGAVKSALQAAGNLNWNTATDPDTTDDILLNVATF